jgi:hypothetical protein
MAAQKAACSAGGGTSESQIIGALTAAGNREHTSRIFPNDNISAYALEKRGGG